MHMLRTKRDEAAHGGETGTANRGGTGRGGAGRSRAEKHGGG